MNIVEKMAKVLLLVLVCYKDGRSVAGQAVRWPVAATRLNKRIFFDDHFFTREHPEGDG